MVNMVNMTVNTYNIVGAICTVDMDGNYRSNMYNSRYDACVYNINKFISNVDVVHKYKLTHP